jgi:hybrid cluster-associated redox disulfide protein
MGRKMTLKPTITADVTVKELLDRFPQLLKIFMEMNLMCAGGPTETFHTLADVAREYHLDLERLFIRIHEALEGTDAPSVDK